MKIAEIEKLEPNMSDDSLKRIEELSENGCEIEQIRPPRLVYNLWCIELECMHCKEKYWRPLYHFGKDIDNSIREKKDLQCFCSRSCKICYNEVINESIFSEMMCEVAKTHHIHVTSEDLLEIWNKQNGICVYTGRKLEIPHKDKTCNPNTFACISRINYYFGYTKDNVQFISNSIKQIRDHVDHEEMVKLCEDIRDFWKDK